MEARGAVANHTGDEMLTVTANSPRRTGEEKRIRERSSMAARVGLGRSQRRRLAPLWAIERGRGKTSAGRM